MEVILNRRGIQLIVAGVLCWFLGTAIWNEWQVFDFEVKEAFISMKDIWIKSSESNQRCWGLFVLLCLAVAGCALIKVLFCGLEGLAEVMKGPQQVHVDRGVFVDGEQRPQRRIGPIEQGNDPAGHL